MPMEENFGSLIPCLTEISEISKQFGNMVQIRKPRVSERVFALQNQSWGNQLEKSIP